MAVAWAYFDTSALLKRYFSEPGSVAVRRFFRRQQVLTSAITPGEIMSVFLRRRREGDLSRVKFEALLRQLQSDRLHWELVEVSGTLLERAEALIQGFIPLGMADAVQVASLITFQTASGMRVPLVTADPRQRDSAMLRGLDVKWAG